MPHVWTLSYASWPFALKENTKKPKNLSAVPCNHKMLSDSYMDMDVNRKGWRGISSHSALPKTSVVPTGHATCCTSKSSKSCDTCTCAPTRPCHVYDLVCCLFPFLSPLHYDLCPRISFSKCLNCPEREGLKNLHSHRLVSLAVFPYLQMLLVLSLVVLCWAWLGQTLC